MEPETRIPNRILDVLMKADLTLYEMKVALAIARTLYGWKTEFQPYKFSFSYIAKETGIARYNVVHTIRKLKDKRIIGRDVRIAYRSRNGYYFRAIKDWKVVFVQTPEVVSIQTPEVVSIQTPQDSYAFSVYSKESNLSPPKSGKPKSNLLEDLKKKNAWFGQVAKLLNSTRQGKAKLQVLGGEAHLPELREFIFQDNFWSSLKSDPANNPKAFIKHFDTIWSQFKQNQCKFSKPKNGGNGKFSNSTVMDLIEKQDWYADWLSHVGDNTIHVSYSDKDEEEDDIPKA